MPGQSTRGVTGVQNGDFSTGPGIVKNDDGNMAETTKESIDKLRIAVLIAGPCMPLLFCWLPPPVGMALEAWTLVGFMSWVVLWWLCEAIPIPATALLPIPLMPILNIADMDAVVVHYANPIIYLFLGGFLMAAAMQSSGLHRRIALTIINLVGSSPGRIIGGFMLATAFLSMWISNTSATIMMFAVAISVIEFVGEKTSDSNATRSFGVALMLAIAYSGTIGGVGTLIGTPPNAMFASYLASTYGTAIDFFTWMLFALPIVLVMLPMAWLILTKLVFKVDQVCLGNVQNLISDEIVGLGRMSSREKLVALVFCCAALGWITRKQLVAFTGLPINDTTIALLGALCLFIFPISRRGAAPILDWQDAKNVPWGMLLLFGGGLALAGAFDSTGLAAWIGQSVSSVRVSQWMLVASIIIAVVYITEVTSNTASTATFLPILGAVAIGMHLDPLLLTLPATLAASMAFMMPVATPPNAIVFTYPGMQLADMLRAGALLNVIAIAVTFAAMYLLAGIVFSVQISP